MRRFIVPVKPTLVVLLGLDTGASTYYIARMPSPVLEVAMAASLDIFVILGEKNYLWLGCAQTDNQALELIRAVGSKRRGVFFIHSQRTGEQSFYRAGPEAGVVQVEKPLDF
jgi:hypothetical protein